MAPNLGIPSQLGTWSEMNFIIGCIILLNSLIRMRVAFGGILMELQPGFLECLTAALRIAPSPLINFREI